MLKNRFERLFFRGLLWVVSLGLIGLLVLFAGAIWEVKGKQGNAHKERKNAEYAYREVQERHSTLTKDVQQFQSQRGIEKEVRERFPVVKEGEEVIVLVDAQDPVVDTSVSGTTNLWTRLKEFFDF